VLIQWLSLPRVCLLRGGCATLALCLSIHSVVSRPVSSSSSSAAKSSAGDEVTSVGSVGPDGAYLPEHPLVVPLSRISPAVAAAWSSLSFYRPVSQLPQAPQQQQPPLPPSLLPESLQTGYLRAVADGYIVFDSSAKTTRTATAPAAGTAHPMHGHHQAHQAAAVVRSSQPVADGAAGAGRVPAVHATARDRPASSTSAAADQGALQQQLPASGGARNVFTVIPSVRGSDRAVPSSTPPAVPTGTASLVRSQGPTSIRKGPLPAQEAAEPARALASSRPPSIRRGHGQGSARSEAETSSFIDDVPPAGSKPFMIL